MNEQPEALRLADELYEAAEEYYLFDKDMGYGAAAELRRLHEVNAELVEALHLCSGWVIAYGQPETRATVLGAIAKATGEQK